MYKNSFNSFNKSLNGKNKGTMIEWFMESGRIPGIKNEQNYKPGYVVG